MTPNSHASNFLSRRLSSLFDSMKLYWQTKQVSLKAWLAMVAVLTGLHFSVSYRIINIQVEKPELNKWGYGFRETGLISHSPPFSVKCQFS
jgi:hypothetical protein